MFPEKFDTVDVTIDLIDPCESTVINSDAGLALGFYDVTIGEDRAVYEFRIPSDSVSLQYGTGYDICGEKIVKVRDADGSEVT